MLWKIIASLLLAVHSYSLILQNCSSSDSLRSSRAAASYLFIRGQKSCAQEVTRFGSFYTQLGHEFERWDIKAVFFQSHAHKNAGPFPRKKGCVKWY